MATISDELRREAGQAFYEYEQAVVIRLLKRPTWKLDAAPLQKALDTEDEQKVKEFVRDLRRGRNEILNSPVA